MKLIGIVGKSGSGKTTLAQFLSKQLNCTYLDTDKICHEAFSVPEIINLLCKNFGMEILDPNGSINRKKLGSIVFSDDNQMKILTDLTWKYLEERIDKILTQTPEIVIIEGVALHQTKYWSQLDFKILVTADDTQRKNKVMSRDHISEEYFQKRDSSNINYSNLNFDYTFENDYQNQSMYQVLEKITQKLPPY